MNRNCYKYLYLYRSLWNMRNYIHCMLCGSMFTALLLFIVGADMTGDEVKMTNAACSHVGIIPSCTQALCSAIAVVLHYLFMVMFMWMLMEGVVLYLILVQVFISRQKRYIIFFTIASFGK